MNVADLDQVEAEFKTMAKLLKGFYQDLAYAPDSRLPIDLAAELTIMVAARILSVPSPEPE